MARRTRFSATCRPRAAHICVALGLALAPLEAQPLPPERAQPSDPELSTHRHELRGMHEQIEASREERSRIETEVASIRTDRARLAAALVETTEAASATEHKIGETERRLGDLLGSEDAIEISLSGRRAVIGAVLAALQRMGRRPPPALLASPEDMLQSIRTSKLLGAVLPEMQAEVEALAADLSDLVHLRRSIAAERASLADDAARLKADRERLAALVEARQSALDAAEKALGTERHRTADLGKQAADLEDLIGRMETEIDAAVRAAATARRADELRKSTAKDPASRTAASPFADPARLAPATAFTETKGLLPLPVSGTLLRGFGHKDGFGGTEKGIQIATRAGAFVASPCDGWVSYAGSYRTYGQILIVNAGQGYYIILAGMDRIHVNVGQFILAGEPVALMGDGSTKTAAALAVGAVQPILYVEFRKDGTAIDPSPWWAKAELQKVRG